MSAARLLIALLLGCAFACGACKSASDEGESAPESTSRDEPAPAGAGTTSEAANDDGQVLEAIAKAGFVPAEGVPFDDEGELPEALAASEAPGQTGLATHVLVDGDERYAQVAVARFESADAARAAAPTTVRHVLVDDAVVIVLAFGDDDVASAIVSALEP